MSTSNSTNPTQPTPQITVFPLEHAPLRSLSEVQAARNCDIDLDRPSLTETQLQAIVALTAHIPFSVEYQRAEAESEATHQDCDYCGFRTAIDDITHGACNDCRMQNAREMAEAEYWRNRL